MTELAEAMVTDGVLLACLLLKKSTDYLVVLKTPDIYEHRFLRSDDAQYCSHHIPDAPIWCPLQPMAHECSLTYELVHYSKLGECSIGYN